PERRVQGQAASSRGRASYRGSEPELPAARPEREATAIRPVRHPRSMDFGCAAPSATALPHGGGREVHPHILDANTRSALAPGASRRNGGPDRLIRRLNRGRNLLHPPAVHDVVLIRAGARLVGGEENDELRDLGGLELSLQALAAHDLGLRFRCDPFLELALRHDPSGRDGVDAYSVGAEVARERTRQA